MKLNEKQKKLITSLAGDFLETVKATEKSVKTTQNHYGKYGQLLSSLSKGNRQHAEIYALALMEAGANKSGVKSALQVFC
jgi:hypothetical protein